ncbi:helix-turn-helix domain-containing protein [Elizabethkingia sp. JS20170427COW]|uniref:helix-turn-helix domain-containing protein n=1 Tax=Elizabethkingia sp. JS20170427COW TaxID=2583851 RepID=UPI0011108066|nr:helix-turn-helix transcriptional regulator [Elizabethkingia sp. JS20170427COW]QCX53686.1 helix-turn-helix transcriptional regulator [Elizabethkingia sp. JS20170427COW]
MKKCGLNIRQIRRSKDFTQEYMAFELGISQKAYSDLENGKVKINTEILFKLSKILDISPAQICSLSETCASENSKKHSELIAYLKDKNIDIPEEFL